MRHRKIGRRRALAARVLIVVVCAVQPRAHAQVCEPVMLSTLGGGAQAVAIVDATAFIANAYDGLLILDVQDPFDPAFLGSLGTPGDAHAVFVDAGVAHVSYLSELGSGIQLIDVSDARHPSVLGSIDTPGFAHAVTLSGDSAYIADGSEGLHVFDVSDPLFPLLFGSMPVPRSAGGLTVRGGTAYVASGRNGLLVIDVSTCQLDTPCQEDLDGSGDVGPANLDAVLDAWGRCAGCPEDFDDSGDVGLVDLVSTLVAWGVCSP